MQTKPGLTSEQHAALVDALRPYGAGLTCYGAIQHGEKVLSVRLEVKRGRLRAIGPTGDVLASFPAADLAASVSRFVEAFWYWKRATE
jgi:hypothetical protein